MVTLDEQKTTEHSNRPPADAADADADAADGYFNEADFHLHHHNSPAKLKMSVLPPSTVVWSV